MAQQYGDPGLMQLKRWGSNVSTTSTSSECSSEWNDIGRPPLPRQRSLSAPSWAQLDVQGPESSAAMLAAVPQAHVQHPLPLNSSVPNHVDFFPPQSRVPGSYSMPQELGMYSEPLALPRGFEYRHNRSPSSYAVREVETVYEEDHQNWQCLPPTAFAAAAAATVASIRRSNAPLHGSNSMSSTSSGGNAPSVMAYSVNSSRTSRSMSSSGSPVAILEGNNSGSAKSLATMDIAYSHAQSGVHQPEQQQTAPMMMTGTAAKPSAQEVAMLVKLKTILNGKEQLSSLERQLRDQIDSEASRAMLSSPGAAAQGPARKAAAHQHHLQQSLRNGSANSISSTCSAPLPRLLARNCQAAAPAAAVPHAMPTGTTGFSRATNSAAAALLANHADPAVVAEYLRAHRLQQQQHLACMSAVSAVAGAGPHGANAQYQSAYRGGMSPAALSKLKQLMSLQHQQIQAQQELLSLLVPQ